MSTLHKWFILLFICGSAWTSTALSQLQPKSWLAMIDQFLPAQRFDANQQQRTIAHRVTADAYSVDSRLDDINDHTLSLADTPVTVEQDHFEHNNDFEHATFFGFSPGGWTDSWAQATIHNDDVPDTDFYLVRGVGGSDFTSGEDGVEISAYAGVQVSNFNSPMTLEVYKQKRDGTPDLRSKVSRSGDGSSTRNLTVALEDGRYYFITVQGTPGRYSLYNGGLMNVQRVKYRDQEIYPTKPGPVKIQIEDVKYFAIESDPALSAIVSPGQQFQIVLIDPARGNTLRKAQHTRSGERLDLARLDPGSAFIVEVRRRTDLAINYGSDATFMPRIESLTSARSSANLIAGGDADTAGAKDGDLSPWRAGRGGPAIVLSTKGLPDRIARGNGHFVFAPGRGVDSGLQQIVHFEGDWLRAIGSGSVKATLAARLGGEGEGSSASIGRIIFLGADGLDLGSPTALSVGARERQVPALISVTTESVVPAAAIAARIEIRFQGGGKGDRPMADNISLTLAEYGE